MARQPVRPRSAPVAAAPGLGLGGWLLRLFKWGMVAALLAAIALGVAVAVAYTQLPSYQSLSNRGDLGQNIRVRSADGKLGVHEARTISRCACDDLSKTWVKARHGQHHDARKSTSTMPLPTMVDPKSAIVRLFVAMFSAPVARPE